MKSGKDERRRSPRISSRIPIQIMDRTNSKSSTLNVSRNGIFFLDSVERPGNSLLRLKLIIPPDEMKLEVFAKVTWQSGAEGDRGSGVEFHQMDTKARERWIEYVAEVEKLNRLTEEASHETERRAAPRTVSSFMVRFKNMQGMEKFFTKNISSGGMFLKTPVLRKEKERVQIVVIHPITHEDVELEAEVVRVNKQASDENQKGMALEFVSLDDDRKEELKGFFLSSDD